MSEAKFTKGKWKIQDDGYGLIGVILKKGLGILIGRKSKETQANAHLIAAAPEMYADIENDIKELSHELNNKNLTPHARAHLTNKLNVKTKLLAKARGEND